MTKYPSLRAVTAIADKYMTVIIDVKALPEIKRIMFKILRLPVIALGKSPGGFQISRKAFSFFQFWRQSKAFSYIGVVEQAVNSGIHTYLLDVQVA